MLLNTGSFDGKTIVSQNSYNELTANHINVTGLKKENPVFPPERLNNTYYGMGIYGSEYHDTDGASGHKIFFHMGGVYGVCTFFAYAPSDGFGIGVLANTGGTDRTIFAELMAWEFLDTVFKFGKIDWANREVSFYQKLEEDKQESAISMAETNPGPPAKLESYIGTYTSPIYGDFKIYLKNNVLVVDNGIRQSSLKHVNRDVFEVNSLDLCEDPHDSIEYVIFYSNEKGTFDKMYISCFSENKTIFDRK
jgi:hypothetical protein